MIMMYTIAFPATSATEYGKAVIKNFQEHPFPDSVKLIGPYSLVDEHGCKSIAILEIEQGKESEVFKVVNKRLVNYLTVPGFGWKEERLLNMEESLSLLGLKAP